MTTWMSGPCQGDREGQREAGHFLPPPFPRASLCCFCAKVSQSLPVLFPVLPPPPRLPSCPRPTPPQRIEMPAQDMGPICVSPACPCVALVSLQPGPASAHLVRPRPLVPNFSSTIGFSHLQGFCHSPAGVPLPAGAGVRPAALGHHSMGGTRSPLLFTEFSGFVLSALAMESLLVCVGVPASHLLPPSSPVPSLFCWSWGFAAPQSHSTAKNLCVCRCVGGQPLASGGLCHVLSSGAVVSLWWLRRKRRGSFFSLAAKCATYQPEL